MSTCKAVRGATGTFGLTIGYTGCRISEALNLTTDGIDFDNKCITFNTLKRRSSAHFRSVPVPSHVLAALDERHGVRRLKSTGQRSRLWPWSRTTGWRRIKTIMAAAEISGPHCCPKGLRHAFAIASIQAGVPLDEVSEALGHSSLEITAIYTSAVGEEKRALYKRLWEFEP